MNKSPDVGKATKPRTVYEKAVQDFTETAQQLARLNQHFRQASFSEFEMLMGLDDEVLKRYGLACTRFRRHRVRCFDGTGGGSWRDGSLLASSSLRLCA